jgi:acyl-CoA thioester hydrolase
MAVEIGEIRLEDVPFIFGEAFGKSALSHWHLAFGIWHLRSVIDMSHFIHRLDVRFRDCDALGHVNNAVYLTYLEQARFAHWRSLWGFGPGRSGVPVSGEPSPIPGVILARVECDYKRPATYGEALEIRVTVADVGRSSFRYDYEIVDALGRTVVTARTVQVMYDYAAGKPVPIPDDIRALLSP